ncbi:type 1 glutamine amidotransferase [Natrarchaeobaculum aegyptiacum]|uniref:Uncharacterized protein n=1 Tax=Natrarchaeobaculum aegyptiacum TaxID=745377 RepID=A0A2Z2HUH8_9EURY|nr:type 1 glutamine amidotransferase [Natrarchaeobaculum aegyptiacum]ARS90820.1 hypothetical protein B1756_14545 [Natrarchaeobaculum aegyptiacum]
MTRPRIGLTQRVYEVEAYEERRDCLDQRWGPFVQSFGLDPVPLPNRVEDVAGYVDRLELDGVVVTGGNDFAHLEDGTNVAPERDEFERTLLEAAIDRNLPVLGVCRGLQLLNLHFGGSLRDVDGHVAKEHELEVDPNATALEDVPRTIPVNSYHGYGIGEDDLGDGLRVCGHVSDGTIEWVEHDRYPITGIMWHPERESPSSGLDRRIIRSRLPTETV